MGLSDNACFYFRKYLLNSDTYLLQVMDDRGNMMYADHTKVREPSKKKEPAIPRVDRVKPKSITGSMIIGWASLKQ